MSRTLFALLLVLLPAALVERAPSAARGDPAQHHSAQAARELFRGRCTSCHVPPDPAFAADRAWLEQVKDTA